MNYFEKNALENAKALNQLRVRTSFIPEYVLQRESVFLIPNSSLNPANIPGFSWHTATAPTITANTPVPFIFMTPSAGRINVVNSLTIITMEDCFLQLNIVRLLNNSIGGGSGTILIEGMATGHCGRIESPTGGTYTFKFDTPLILKSGDRLIAYYYRNATTGIRSAYSFDGYSLTNDTDFDAKDSILVIGDSISGITSEEGALQSGLWPFIIKDRFNKVGKDVRLINIAQGGTNTNQWDWWIRGHGRIDGIKAKLLFINLGMNDAASTYGLTSETGYTKTGIKNIVERYLLNNPDGKVVVNSITATDKTPNVTNLSAYRSELEAAVNEMKALNLPVYFADTSTAYSASTGVAFVSTEQAAGARLHPNTTVGQPAMAEIIWNVCKDLLD